MGGGSCLVFPRFGGKCRYPRVSCSCWTHRCIMLFASVCWGAPVVCSVHAVHVAPCNTHTCHLHVVRRGIQQADKRRCIVTILFECSPVPPGTSLQPAHALDAAGGLQNRLLLPQKRGGDRVHLLRLLFHFLCPTRQVLNLRHHVQPQGQDGGGMMTLGVVRVWGQLKLCAALSCCTISVARRTAPLRST